MHGFVCCNHAARLLSVGTLEAALRYIVQALNNEIVFFVVSNAPTFENLQGLSATPALASPLDSDNHVWSGIHQPVLCPLSADLESFRGSHLVPFGCLGALRRNYAFRAARSWNEAKGSFGAVVLQQFSRQSHHQGQVNQPDPAVGSKTNCR